MIEIQWQIIDPHEDDRWYLTRVLYAYVDPSMREILYIGKADGGTSSVRTRLLAADKRAFWDSLSSERKISGAHVLVGDLMMLPGARLTRELLADVESLLIAVEQPWGNIQARQSRIRRPGLRVKSLGPWPGARLVEDR